MASRTRGVTFYIGDVSEDNTNKYHSYRDWGLHLSDVQNPNPEPKYNFLSIPGSSDLIDLAELFGQPTFNPRTLTFTFQVTNGSYARYSRNGNIANALHGKSLKIVLDDDPQYFYKGRLNFTEWVYLQENGIMGTLTFSCTCDPYRYNINSEAEPWKWDSFSFVDGVVTGNLGVFTVNGSVTKTIVGTNKIIYLEVQCSAPMTFSLDGENTVSVKAGKTTLYDMPIPYGEKSHTLVVKGNGVVSTDYRGVKL